MIYLTLLLKIVLNQRALYLIKSPPHSVFASTQLEQTLRLETGDGERDSPESRSLAQQNVDLRRRLDEEQAAYKRKLTAYQEGQQRQAQLVQKLQAKVLFFSFTSTQLYFAGHSVVNNARCSLPCVSCRCCSTRRSVEI